MSTTHIPAILTPGSAALVASITGTQVNRLTKAALRKVLSGPDGGGPDLEFVSQSMFHNHGSWFTLSEAFGVYGPVSIEVRKPNSDLLAVINYDGTKVRVA